MTPEQIEELVGEAYEVGHAHGSNTWRLSRGEAPQMVDLGWSQYAEQIKDAFAKAPAWHARPTSPGWWLHWKQGEMFYAQDAADESWESHGAVYGPIPEPPEMPT